MHLCIYWDFGEEIKCRSRFRGKVNKLHVVSVRNDSADATRVDHAIQENEASFTSHELT